MSPTIVEDLCYACVNDTLGGTVLATAKDNDASIKEDLFPLLTLEPSWGARGLRSMVRMGQVF